MLEGWRESTRFTMTAACIPLVSYPLWCGWSWFFSWLQMKNILFAREIIGRYRWLLLKCAKNKITPVKATAAKTGFVTQAQGKGPSDLLNEISIRVKFFFAQTRPPGGSKNVILCFLENMRYIRDGICTGHRRSRICISVPAGKKDTKNILIKIQSINRLYKCWDWMGEGG